MRETSFPDQPHSFAGLDKIAERIGVIDIGSNSERLVVYEGGLRNPAVVFNEMVMCGLGAGLATTGALNPEGKVCAAAELAGVEVEKRLRRLAEALGLESALSADLG